MAQNREIAVGEKYNITVMSRKYLTLLRANNLGQVQRLFENVRVDPGAHTRLPQDRDLSIESTVEDGYRYATELAVALLCPRQIEFDYSEIVEDSYPSEYNYRRCCGG